MVVIKSSRKYRRAEQTHCLLEATHQIHVLNRLPRRALNEIVNGRDHNEPPRALIDLHADVAEITSHHVLNLRHLPGRQYSHKRFLAIMMIEYLISVVHIAITPVSN